MIIIPFCRMVKLDSFILDDKSKNRVIYVYNAVNVFCVKFTPESWSVLCVGFHEAIAVLHSQKLESREWRG